MTSIKCESCGGNNIFDPSTGRLICERCGRKYVIQGNVDSSVQLVRNYTNSYIPQIKEAGSNQYLCSTCGATVTFEDDEERRRCPSCGDLGLVKESKAIYVPDGIIPFEVSKDKAIEVFRQWINSRKFTPRDLKEMAKLGKVSGIYVPAFNFNFQINSTYNANVTKTEKHGENYVARHIYLDSGLERSYKNILLSGNTRINNSTLDHLEPYDTMTIRPYSNEFVYGFSGLDTNIDVHSSYDSMIRTKYHEIESRLRTELHKKYDSIEYLNMEYSCHGSTFNYVYVPIWANHYNYHGKEYHCYINGQTGKATGKSPKSFWKILGLVGGIVAAVGVVVLALVL